MATALKALLTVFTLGLNLAFREPTKTIVQDAQTIEDMPDGAGKDYLISRMEANGSSRRAKRFLAMMTGAVWAFAWVLPILLELITGRVLQSVEALQIAVSAPFALVMACYFAKDGVGAAIKALINGISRRKE